MSVQSLCSWCFKPDLGSFSLVCMNCLLRHMSCENCYSELGGVYVPPKPEEYDLERFFGVSLESSTWCRKCTLLDQSYLVLNPQGDVIFKCYDRDDIFAVDGHIVYDVFVIEMTRKLILELERIEK